MKKLTLTLTMFCLMLAMAAPALAGKLDDIAKRGTLICGVKDTVPGFGIVDEKTKQIVGFDVEMCQIIADNLGVKLELKPVTSATRIPMLAQGQVDLVGATMTHKKSREEQIDFSITYFNAAQKLLVKKDSGIKSVADLKGKKVASVKGSTSEKNVKAAQPDCTVISFENYPEAFLALKQGKAVAVTTDDVILAGLIGADANPDQWEIVGEPISAEPYGLGVPENDSDFRDAVNVALMEAWESGSFQKAYEKWFGPKTNTPLPLTWKLELWP